VQAGQTQTQTQFSEILQASTIYASDLSERLRERVYKQVVPQLALAVADRVGGKGEEDLERHYRTALTILFRGCS